MAFGNLTVDFRQLSNIPVRDRAALARSPQASEIFGNLTPTEIAALFPDYYKKFIPAATGSGLASGLSGGTTPYSPPVSTGSAPSAPGTAPPIVPAGPKVPVFVDEILKKGDVETNIKTPKGKLGLYRPQYALTDADLSDEVIRTVAGEAYMSSKEGVDAVINVMLNRVGSKEYGSNLAAVARQGHGTKAVQFEGYNKGKPTEKQAEYIRERIRILASGAEPDNTYGANEFRADWYVFGEGKGKPFYRDAEKQGFVNIGGNIFAARGNYSGPYQGYSKDEVQKRLEEASKEIAETIPGTEASDTALPTSETGVIPFEQGPATTVQPELQSFDPKILEKYPNLKDYYDNATADEKKLLETAITRIGSTGVQEIMEKHPSASAEAVTDTIVRESDKTATNVSDMVNQDPLTFWKQRNPQGARIEDLDIETLRTSMMAAMKLEADMAAQGKPKRVEIYGPSSGVRNEISGSRHSVPFKDALDIAIYDVDPNTGEKLKSKSGAYGNYANKPNHGGIDPEGYALYHEFGQNAELARIFLADQGDTNYQNWAIRQGGLFSDVEWDFMHIDRSPLAKPGDLGVSTHRNPHGRGDVAYGYSTSALKELGIDPKSDAGKRLMTGVVERFGGEGPATKESIAKAARQAYGPKLEQDSAEVVQTTTEQPLPGAAAQTPEQRPSETDVIPFQQAPAANTTPNMQLGGTEKIRSSVDEPLSIVARDRDGGENRILNFNPDERVVIKNGEAEVTSEYKEKARETLQQTDMGGQQSNQYSMQQRISNESPRTFPEQVKYGIIPESPSIARQTRMAKFGNDHFERASKNI